MLLNFQNIKLIFSSRIFLWYFRHCPERAWSASAIYEGDWPSFPFHSFSCILKVFIVIQDSTIIPQEQVQFPCFLVCGGVPKETEIEKMKNHLTGAMSCGSKPMIIKIIPLIFWLYSWGISSSY